MSTVVNKEYINEQRLEMDTSLSEIKNQYKKEKRSKFIQRCLSNKTLMISSSTLLFIFIIMLITPFITKYDPLTSNVIDRMKGPSMDHLFGTDRLGRDVFSRVLYGTRISLLVGTTVGIMSGLIGCVIGLYSAYYRKLDNILMRFMDGIMSIPEILLAIILMASLGPSTLNVLISLSVVFIPTVARTIRSAALSVKEQPYIEALKSIGASSKRIIWCHILPNCLSSLLVQTAYVFSFAIIIESSLSFLGVGTPPPTPSWGAILQEGAVVIDVGWWMTVFPGAAILLTIVSSNLLSDGIRDFIDQHSR
ncbi:MAG: ABC transporter permease [Bacillus sp. (in: firmicutes)]